MIGQPRKVDKALKRLSLLNIVSCNCSTHHNMLLQKEPKRTCLGSFCGKFIPPLMSTCFVTLVLFLLSSSTFTLLKTESPPELPSKKAYPLGKTLYLLLPSLAVSVTISVPTVAVPSTLSQKVIESDSDAEATSGFESFGSFAGLQSLSKLDNFGDIGDLDGQFDSSGFDRVFSAQNRRFDSGVMDEFPVPASKALADRKAFHGVAASPVARQHRPQSAAVAPQHSRYRAAAAPAQRGPSHAPHASQVFRPAQHAVAAQRGPSHAPHAPQVFRPAQHAVAAGALKPVQEVHPGSRPTPYSVTVLPNGYPTATVTAAYSVHPQPSKHNPQRYSAVHANKYHGRNAVYQPQGSSPVQSNKFQEEFQRQLGGGFGDNENHGFDFGSQGF